MSQPSKIAQSFEHYAVWDGSIAQNGTAQIAFTPVDAGASASGPPQGASGSAVPVLIAHEILISNPGASAIEVTPVGVQSSDAYSSWLPYQSTMRPMYVDPTTFPAVSSSNRIIVPAGAIAFPIRVRAVGITISSPIGATTPSVAAYGPLSLEA